MSLKPAERFSVKDLHGTTAVPLAYLRRILQELARAGLLKSTRGKGGGFDLARTPEKIMLTEVIDIFQGEMKLTDCIFESRLCTNSVSCKLRSKIQQIEDHAKKELGVVTIASLL